MLGIKSMLATVSGIIVGVSSANLALYNTSQLPAKAESNGVSLWGDANCDGDVGISDAVLILQAITNPDKFGVGKQGGLSKKGRLNADVYENGTGLTCMDALAIQKFEAGIIKELPESYVTEKGTTETGVVTTSTTATTETSSTDDVTTTSITTVTQTESGKTETTTTVVSTAEATTVSQTTTSTETDVATVTTTTTNTWTPPQMEELIHQGQMISPDEYNILLQTAKLAGISQYSIQYSDNIIEYGYKYPGLYWCIENGFSDGFAVQVVPQNDTSQITGKTLGDDYQYAAVRPLVKADTRDEVKRNQQNAVIADIDKKVIVGAIRPIVIPKGFSKETEEYYWNLDELNDSNPFEFRGWYLIPTSDSKPDKSITYPYTQCDLSAEPGIESPYWCDSADLNVDGNPIGKTIFNGFVYTAKQWGFKGFKIKYNNSANEPVYYAFTSQGLINCLYVNQGAVQIVKTEDLIQLVDVKSKCLQKANGDSAMADKYYQELMNPKKNPCYYWTWADNVDGINEISDDTIAVFKYSYTDRYDGFVMIPTDEDGEEIKKVWCHNDVLVFLA